MKPIVDSLIIGQKVWVTVEEEVNSTELIVNFSGDLLRISNQSQKKFRPGQRIQLNVSSTSPLAFRLVDTPRMSTDRARFDRLV